MALKPYARTFAVALLIALPTAIAQTTPHEKDDSPLRSQFSRGLPLAPPRVAPGRTTPPGRTMPRPRPLPPSSTAFTQMVRAAGMIFSGTVTSIAVSSASFGSTPQTVAITFHVEQAIRGISPEHDLTISQWMGLWTGGQTYRMGERVLLLLYPPSKLDLTSPVGGNLGRFSVDPAGRVRFNQAQVSVFGADPVLRGRSLVSLRDFAQAVQRAGGEE